DAEVLPAPGEQRVRLDAHQHVQVARGATPVARFAPARQPDALPVVDPRGDPHGERARLGDSAGSPAVATLLVDDRADALAFAAGLRELERTLVRGHQAHAVALRTGPRLGAGLGPRTVAGLARA